MLAQVPWTGMFALASDPDCWRAGPACSRAAAPATKGRGGGDVVDSAGGARAVGWTGWELTMRETASRTIYLATDFASTDIPHL
ncbi:hypothetical protein SETIT_3G041900v2 [Setaria italica]|uniref:Uncharacterized protein n=1 Tax=Setaria italica TaxID=4555 RepID=A0A368QBI3_SETIT|nr:hypothetical protein SETIT_3G041900v2 [Setaria italica]